MVWTTATMVLVEMAVTVDQPGTAPTVGTDSMRQASAARTRRKQAPTVARVEVAALAVPAALLATAAVRLLQVSLVSVAMAVTLEAVAAAETAQTARAEQTFRNSIVRVQQVAPVALLAIGASAEVAQSMVRMALTAQGATEVPAATAVR